MRAGTWSESARSPACGSQWSESAPPAKRPSCSRIRSSHSLEPECEVVEPPAPPRLGRADRCQARDRNAAATLPDIVAVVAVGAVTDRDPGGWIAPTDLTARTAMT